MREGVPARGLRAALLAIVIYPTLTALEAEGLVEGDDDEGDGRGRRVYTLTLAGLAELRRWLAEMVVEWCDATMASLEGLDPGPYPAPPSAPVTDTPA